MTRGLLDTSAVIGGLRGTIPDELAISVITLGELHAGVLMASDERARADRLKRLGDVQRSFALIDVDPQVAQTFGELRASTRRRAVADLLIAATAVVHDMVLVTHDARQAALVSDRALLLT